MIWLIERPWCASFVLLSLCIWLLLAQRLDASHRPSPTATLLVYLPWGSFWALLLGIGIILQCTQALLLNEGDWKERLGIPEHDEVYTRWYDSLIHYLGPAGIVLITLSFLALICLRKFYLQWLALFLPLHPPSATHRLALSLCFGLPVLSLMHFFVMRLQEELEIPTETKTPALLFHWALFGALMLFCTLAGAGWPYRSLHETARRLGLTPPSWLALSGSIVIGGGLPWLIAPLLPLLAEQLPVTRVVQDAEQQTYFALLESPQGVLLFILLCSITQELLFRGALLPRVGVVISSVLFALFHTETGFSFHFWLVLLAGLALGTLHHYTNNTYVTMAAHLSCNCSIVALHVMLSSV